MSPHVNANAAASRGPSSKRVRRSDVSNPRATTIGASAPQLAPATCACGGPCPRCAGVGQSVPASVHRAIGRPGRELPGSFRTRAEHFFGADLSHVRLHDDETAGEAAAQSRALALTAQNHILLSRSRRDLTQPAAQRTLVHELTHTLGARTGSQAPSFFGADHSAPESAAATASRSFASGSRVAPTLAKNVIGDGAVHREPDPRLESLASLVESAPLTLTSDGIAQELKRAAPDIDLFDPDNRQALQFMLDERFGKGTADDVLPLWEVLQQPDAAPLAQSIGDLLGAPPADADPATQVLSTAGRGVIGELRAARASWQTGGGGAQAHLDSAAIQIVELWDPALEILGYPNLRYWEGDLRMHPDWPFDALAPPHIDDSMFVGVADQVDTLITQIEALAGYEPSDPRLESGYANAIAALAMLDPVFVSLERHGAELTYERLTDIRDIGFGRDVLASIMEAPLHVPELLGELAVYIYDNLDLIVFSLAAFMAIETGLGAISATGIGAVLNVLFHSLVILMLGYFVKTELTDLIAQAQTWWDRCSEAHGDPELITEASRAFVHVLGDMVLIILALAGIRTQVTAIGRTPMPARAPPVKQKALPDPDVIELQEVDGVQVAVSSQLNRPVPPKPPAAPDPNIVDLVEVDGVWVARGSEATRTTPAANAPVTTVPTPQTTSPATSGGPEPLSKGLEVFKNKAPAGIAASAQQVTSMLLPAAVQARAPGLEQIMLGSAGKPNALVPDQAAAVEMVQAAYQPEVRIVPYWNPPLAPGQRDYVILLTLNRTQRVVIFGMPDELENMTLAHEIWHVEDFARGRQIAYRDVQADPGISDADLIKLSEVTADPSHWYMVNRSLMEFVNYTRDLIRWNRFPSEMEASDPSQQMIAAAIEVNNYIAREAGDPDTAQYQSFMSDLRTARTTAWSTVGIRAMLEHLASLKSGYNVLRKALPKLPHFTRLMEEELPEDLRASSGM
jgi:hypothetical protein